MAVPDFQTMMLPFLQVLADGKEYSTSEIREKLRKHFDLNADDLSIKLKSGSTRFNNNISWVKVYLGQALLTITPRRGFTQITQRGIEELKYNPEALSTSYLTKYPEFVDFKTRKSEKTIKTKVQTDTNNEKTEVEEGIVDKIKDAEKVIDNKIKDVEKIVLIQRLEDSHSSTPIEMIEKGIDEINSELKRKIFEYIMNNDFYFFEELVVKLLGQMGYGNELEDKEVTKKTGDEGIDGIIKEDKLGLEYIYIQAKRWQHTVSRPEIQKFVGALLGKKAKKGVFFTTSDYSKGAYEYAANVEHSVILINKEKLLDLIVEFNLGVYITNSYEIKKIDIDFYEET
jgi:restriction system protein